MHDSGYEVPSVTVTMRMETVDSDQNLDEQQLPSKVYVDFLSMLIARHAMMLRRVLCRKKERNGRTEYPIET